MEFLDARPRHGLPSSLVQRRCRPARRVAVVLVTVDEETVSLDVRLSVDPSCVLVIVLELLCDGLRLPELSLRALGLRVRAVHSCSTDVCVFEAARTFRDVRGVGSSITDSLRRPLIVGDCTSALYLAAMRSATGATLATRCFL